MMIKFSLYIAVLLLLSTPLMSASSVVVYQSNTPSEINLSAFYNIFNQVVINIPYQAFNGVSYVDGLTFVCGKSTNTTGGWAFRIYSFDSIGTYYLEDAYTIDQSACLDWGYPLYGTFTGPIDVSDYYVINRSIAIGIYSTATAGNLYIFGSNLSLNYSTPSISQNNNISGINGNEIFFPDGVSIGEPIQSSYHKLYGGFALPTPTPTPTSTYSPPANSSGINESYTGHNTEYNSSANTTYSTIPNDTGFDGLLKDEGLCTSGTCHTNDMTEWLQRHINDFWLLTLGLVIWRFWSG